MPREHIVTAGPLTSFSAVSEVISGAAMSASASSLAEPQPPDKLEDTRVKNGHDQGNGPVMTPAEVASNGSRIQSEKELEQAAKQQQAMSNFQLNPGAYQATLSESSPPAGLLAREEETTHGDGGGQQTDNDGPWGIVRGGRKGARGSVRGAQGGVVQGAMVRGARGGTMRGGVSRGGAWTRGDETRARQPRLEDRMLYSQDIQMSPDHPHASNDGEYGSSTDLGDFDVKLLMFYKTLPTERYSLSQEEIGKLLFHTLRLPIEKVKGFDCTDGRRVKLYIEKGYDYKKHCTTYATDIRDGLRLEPMARKDKIQPVRLERIPFEISDADVKKELEKFGVLHSDVFWVKYTKTGNVHSDKMHGKLKNERVVRMEVKKNIPSYVRIGQTKILCKWRGQEFTCARCHRTRVSCRGGAKAKECKEAGGDERDIANEDVWNEVVREAMDLEVVCDPSEEITCVEVSGFDLRDGWNADKVLEWIRKQSNGSDLGLNEYDFTNNKISSDPAVYRLKELNDTQVKMLLSLDGYKLSNLSSRRAKLKPWRELREVNAKYDQEAKKRYQRYPNGDLIIGDDGHPMEIEEEDVEEVEDDGKKEEEKETENQDPPAGDGDGNTGGGAGGGGSSPSEGGLGGEQSDSHHQNKEEEKSADNEGDESMEDDDGQTEQTDMPEDEHYNQYVRDSQLTSQEKRQINLLIAEAEKNKEESEWLEEIENLGEINVKTERLSFEEKAEVKDLDDLAKRKLVTGNKMVKKAVSMKARKYSREEAIKIAGSAVKKNRMLHERSESKEVVISHGAGGGSPDMFSYTDSEDECENTATREAPDGAEDENEREEAGGVKPKKKMKQASMSNWVTYTTRQKRKRSNTTTPEKGKKKEERSPKHKRQRNKNKKKERNESDEDFISPKKQGKLKKGKEDLTDTKKPGKSKNEQWTSPKKVKGVKGSVKFKN